MKLSVLVTTYNHAPFIRQALESVAAQTTSFDYEIVIADDCSDDGTREIVREFAAGHAGPTQLILPDSNLGRGGNPIFFRQLEATRGEYTAMLDGDDYWTSRHKLQMQVDFLDAHPECSTCFHDVNVVYDDLSTPSHLFHQDRPWGELTALRPKPISTLADIVRGDFIATCSAVFRTPGPLPAWYYDVAYTDWPLHVLNAERGSIAYIDEVMGTYRVHAGGLWSMDKSRNRRLEDVEAVVAVHDAINRHLAFAFDPQITDDVAHLYERAAVNFLRMRARRWASICARRSLRRLPATRRIRRWRSMVVVALTALGRLVERRTDALG
jgi:glycosyltransferase involved in cell wall biosynthesis